MAAAVARERPRVVQQAEEEPASPTSPDSEAISLSRQAQSQEWLIFGQPSPSLSGSSLEPASVGSADWDRLDAVDNDAQIGSLPAHDGQGLFAMDETESLCASAQPEWAHVRIATDSDSTRLSFSTSSSHRDIVRGIVLPARAHSPLRTQPLTEHALAGVPDNRIRAHDEEEEAALTASSDNERLSDVEELLSRTPQAASAGIQTTPRARRKADHAGVKRRHRKSGLSDKGSKRSNASSSAVSMAISTVGLANPSVERRAPLPGKGLLLGTVVRKVFSVDEDLLEMVAETSPDRPERGATSTTTLPRAPARPSRFRRRVNLEHESGFSSFAKHLRDEMGDFSGYATGMTDSGEDTEMDYSAPRLVTIRRSSSAEGQSLTRAAEASPARSMSLTSLPLLLESMYSSLPSELFQSTTPQPGASSPIRRATSLGAETRSAALTPAVEPARMSYWRMLLRRLRSGFDIAAV